MMDALTRLRGRVAVLTAIVCVACTLPYWRAMFLPLISDSYLQVSLGRKYLHFSTWPDLASDALYRCRATSIWLTGAMDALFGSAPIFLKTQSLFLHVLNVALIAALGRFPKIGYRISVPAALLWGLNERHHEAVIWYAALPEQLVFFFVLLTFFLWLEWWDKQTPLLYFASFCAFLFALLSKESAVVACALLGFPVFFEPRNWRPMLRGAIPFLAVSAIYFAANHAARENHLHWNDGTFTLGWHFIPVMMRSMARLLTLWGFAALAVIFFLRKQIDWRLPAIALLWIPIALAPYAFVAYQPRVPSRHVYLASLGVAMLMAIALEKWNPRRQLLFALLAAYLLFNTGYLWFYKHPQFLERAEVTERLVRDATLLTAKEGIHPLEINCFPLAPEIANIVLSQRLNIRESQIVVHDAKNSNCGPPTINVVLD